MRVKRGRKPERCPAILHPTALIAGDRSVRLNCFFTLLTIEGEYAGVILKAMAEAETEGEEKRSSRHWGIFLLPLVVIALYVLSVGPVCMAVDRNVISRKCLVIYEPLDGLRGTFLEPALRAYVHLWIRD